VEKATEEGKPDLEAFIAKYLRNTNGLRDFRLAQEKCDELYAKWCIEQAEKVAARQNHMDAGVMSTGLKAEKILTKVELMREYDEERVDKLDSRLEKIEKKVAK
jgi:hypothetical protein